MQRYLCALALVLAGCSSPQGIFDEQFPKYRGRNVNLLFEKWGTPSRDLVGDGGRIYLWENVPPARNCRLEAHADDRNNLIGVRFRGSDEACLVWMQMLR